VHVHGTIFPAQVDTPDRECRPGAESGQGRHARLTNVTPRGEAGVFVAGKPLTDIWAAPGLRWRDTLAAAILGPLRHPYLRFVRNDRNQFDLDNLVYPVLAVAGCSACESVWADVDGGPVEGVWIAERQPPPPPSGSVSVRIERPNTSSVAGRPSPPELADAAVVAQGSLVGMSLAFDAPDVKVGEMSYEGPTKSLIDDLGPMLGFHSYQGRMVSNDNRVKELRITRGHRPGGGGVVVSVWPLTEARSLVPPARAERLRPPRAEPPAPASPVQATYVEREMARSNRDRVGRAMELLGTGLGSYVDRRMRSRSIAASNWRDLYTGYNVDSDPAALVRVILDNWQGVFRDELSGFGRSLLEEARNWRNDWAHNRAFSDRDAGRAIDTVERLLAAIDASEAAEIGQVIAETEPSHVQVEVPGATPGRDRARDRTRETGPTDAAVHLLRGEFTRAMLNICDRFKREIDYNPTRFRQMVVDRGGPEAAKRLLAGTHVQLGLETLRWHGRLHESVEVHRSRLAGSVRATLYRRRASHRPRTIARPWLRRRCLPDTTTLIPPARERLAKSHGHQLRVKIL
jgi:hypothetical protein